LREARVYIGMTASEAAASAGVAEDGLASIECGERLPDDLEVQRLARAYGYRTGYFTSEDDPLPDDTVAVLARLTRELSERDRAEVERFAEYLRHASGD
jgi:transcriptional regulator with XRE-family HTH domain